MGQATVLGACVPVPRWLDRKHACVHDNYCTGHQPSTITHLPCAPCVHFQTQVACSGFATNFCRAGCPIVAAPTAGGQLARVSAGRCWNVLDALYVVEYSRLHLLCIHCCLCCMWGRWRLAAAAAAGGWLSCSSAPSALLPDHVVQRQQSFVMHVLIAYSSDLCRPRAHRRKPL